MNNKVFKTRIVSAFIVIIFGVLYGYIELTRIILLNCDNPVLFYTPKSTAIIELIGMWALWLLSIFMVVWLCNKAKE